MLKATDGALAMSLLMVALPAIAVPPPPGEPPLLRKATMTVTVELIEAHKGSVTKITRLCRVSGKIPVYADDGSAAHAHGKPVSGCYLTWKGKTLPVHIAGAKAIAKRAPTYASAVVSVVPPDAPLACSMCGPQALAMSRAEIRISGAPTSMAFSLNADPGSILNSKPTVWLEADVEIID